MARRWNPAQLDWFEALLEEQDVDIMGWAIGTHTLPRALGGADDGDDARARFRAGCRRQTRMTDPRKILSAKAPLTLAGVPAGFLPVLLADLARAAPSRVVLIAPDEAEMRSVAATVGVLRARAGGDRLSGVGLPALRSRLARRCA